MIVTTMMCIHATIWYAYLSYKPMTENHGMMDLHIVNTIKSCDNIMRNTSFDVSDNISDAIIRY